MSTKTVLVVEDHDDNRKLFALMLEYAGYGVVAAADGAEGIEIAREWRPDLILMDLSMPVMSGWDAVAALKSEPATAGIPVFAVSAQVPLDGEQVRARNAGFECYLTKPIPPTQIVQQVRQRIGGPAAARVETIRS